MPAMTVPDLGEKSNAAVLDPTEVASAIALLKGMMIQLQGGSGSTGYIPVSLATRLNSTVDSIDVARQAKGSVTVALSSIVVTTQSSEIDCRGFNAASVECALAASTAGSYVVSVQGCAISGGTFGNCYSLKDDGSHVAMATPSMSVNGNYTYHFRGIPNYIKVTGTRSTDGTLTCKVTPMNF
jgi:hypothetical protein